MKCNIGFSFFKKFDKVVNTFANARDMHVFPTIQKKIQVKYHDNDLSIGKKFWQILIIGKKRGTQEGITGAQAIKR